MFNDFSHKFHMSMTFPKKKRPWHFPVAGAMPTLQHVVTGPRERQQSKPGYGSFNGKKHRKTIRKPQEHMEHQLENPRGQENLETQWWTFQKATVEPEGTWWLVSFSNCPYNSLHIDGKSLKMRGKTVGPNNECPMIVTDSV